jgi:ATPase complex subunit ATP10
MRTMHGTPLLYDEAGPTSNHFSPSTMMPIPSASRRFFSSIKRVTGLKLHPDAVGTKILPGGTSVIKHDAKTGQDRTVLLERAHGHFWMLNDLTATDSRPILPNKKLISEQEAMVFPNLSGVRALVNDEAVHLPDYFLETNRARDASAQCTLVAICFRQYGLERVQSWTQPFEQAYGEANPRAPVMTLSITATWIGRMLSGFLIQSQRRNTPPKLHPQTLLYYGSATQELIGFQDSLRMHNTLTGYVYLLDGLGRVRFAGSGNASDREVKGLVHFARQLCPKLRAHPTRDALR